MTPQAVIFDIGNVLIEWQPEKHFDIRIGPERRKAFFTAVDIHGMMNRIDEGGNFSLVVEETAKAHPNWADEILWFRDGWCEIAQPSIDHSVRLLRALRRKDIPVFALSNFGAQNFPLSEAQFPFLTEFDKRYISGEMGMIKPDTAIYAAVEDDCGIAPEALLFVDDREENIEAAVDRGWQGHLFVSPEGWAECLVEFGLMNADEAA